MNYDRATTGFKIAKFAKEGNPNNEQTHQQIS